MQARPQQRRPFIAVEGPDLSGKTTLVKGLAQKYVEAGHPCLPTRNPAGTDFGAALRRSLIVRETPLHPETQLLAFVAGHTQLVHEVLYPNEAEYWVIMDRYKLSTFVYQGVLPYEPIARFMDRFNELTKFLPEPDLYIVVQARPEVLMERRNRRNSPPTTKKSAKKKMVKVPEPDIYEDGNGLIKLAEAWSGPRRWVKPEMRDRVFVVDSSDRDEDELLEFVWSELNKLWPVARDEQNGNPALDLSRKALKNF